MSLQFDSLQEFALMGGHGPFVWASFGITAVMLIYLVVSPLLRRRRFMIWQRRRLNAMASQPKGEGTRQY